MNDNEYSHLSPHCTQLLDPNDALWVNSEEPQTLLLYRRSELVYAALVIACDIS